MDTGPLVALFREREPLHAAAQTALNRFKSAPVVCTPVLTEALHFVSAPVGRRRLRLAFEAGILELGGPGQALGETTRRALAWMERYSEHEPDFADAFLVTWSDAEHLPVWTFDSEFTTTWRSAKGRRVRLFEPPVR